MNNRQFKLQLYNYYKDNNLNRFKECGQKYPEMLDYYINGDTLLHHAIASKDYDFIKVLLELGARIDNPNTYGEYPLYDAIKQMDLKAVCLLVEARANLSEINEEETEALDFAIMFDNIEVVEYLISKGALYHKFTGNVLWIKSRKMVKLLEKNKHIFNKEGLEHWEEAQIELLFKE